MAAETAGPVDGTSVDVEVSITGVGTNADSEPQPRGTIVLSGPPERYVWVQAISAEDYERLVSAGAADGEGFTEHLGSGVTRTAFASGDEFRLVSSDGSVQPSEVAPFLFRLEALPRGMTFVQADVGATMAVDADPSTEPLAVFPTGTSTLRIAVGGAEFEGTLASARRDAVVGLLLLRRTQEAPGAWSGQIAPEHDLVVLEDPSRERIVVVHRPSDAQALIDARGAIFDRINEQ